jgi:hypothetical protein
MNESRSKCLNYDGVCPITQEKISSMMPRTFVKLSNNNCYSKEGMTEYLVSEALRREPRKLVFPDTQTPILDRDEQLINGFWVVDPERQNWSKWEDALDDLDNSYDTQSITLDEYIDGVFYYISYFSDNYNKNLTDVKPPTQSMVDKVQGRSDYETIKDQFMDQYRIHLRKPEQQLRGVLRIPEHLRGGNKMSKKKNVSKKACQSKRHKKMYNSYHSKRGGRRTLKRAGGKRKSMRRVSRM